MNGHVNLKGVSSQPHDSQSKVAPASVAVAPSPTPTPVTSFASPNSSKLEQAKQKVTSATQTKEDEVAKKILNIQRYYRGHLARKKYQIKHLAAKDQTQIATYIVGNDPWTSVEQLEKYQAKAGHQIVLIGTSGLRSVLLACQLTAKNEKSIPKVIIIDNSLKVYQLWEALKKFANDHDTEASFLAALPQFHSKYVSLVKDKKENILRLFEYLYENFTYGRVKSIIVNTIFIRQCWTNKKTFSALKNICSRLNIGNVYAYPSNIIGCEVELKRGHILENIQILQPKLAIYTDYCETHARPDNTHLITKHDESGLASKLRINCLAAFFPRATPESKILIDAVKARLVTAEQIGRLTKEQTESILKINTAAEVGEKVKEYLSGQSNTIAPASQPMVKK